MFNITNKNIPQITVESLKAALDAKENLVLLDVRTVGEYSRGKLTGSINVPLDELMNQVELKIPDKSAKVYVYCLSGSRSVYAVEAMIRLGYSNIFNVTNGLLAWRAKKYPVSS